MKVLDASVLLKWVVPEPGQTEALRFRDRHLAREDAAAVPVLAWYEVANALRRRQNLSHDDRAQAVSALWDFGLDTHDVDARRLEVVMELARTRGISVYDASYVVLARELKCQFVTADRRLWERMTEEKDVVLLGGAE